MFDHFWLYGVFLCNLETLYEKRKTFLTREFSETAKLRINWTNYTDFIFRSSGYESFHRFTIRMSDVRYGLVDHVNKVSKNSQHFSQRTLNMEHKKWKIEFPDSRFKNQGLNVG